MACGCRWNGPAGLVDLRLNIGKAGVDLNPNLVSRNAGAPVGGFARSNDIGAFNENDSLIRSNIEPRLIEGQKAFDRFSERFGGGRPHTR